MDEQNIQKPAYTPYAYPPRKPPVTFGAGKGELLYGVWMLVFSMAVCNGLFFAGGNLLFGVAVPALLGGTAFYLIRRGHRFGWYETALLALCGIIAAGFIKSADGGMKLLMLLLLMAVPGLGFCIAAGQNRYGSAGVLSLLDSPRATFGLGVGCMGEAGRGVREAFRSSGAVGKKTGAVGLGLLIAVPVVAVMIPLLMSADAAFEGLLDLLPEFEGEETMVTAILGAFLGIVLYTRGVALHHNPKSDAEPKPMKGVHPLTVNTILIAVAAVYLAYLFSQLAYFVGGFAGILPEDYTMAEYARRGFFEMSQLCTIDLAIIALAVGLVKKESKTPLLTRILCLFIGLITVFLVATASAKMLMYIGSYGLTRARVLTEVFMVWLAITTVLVCVWLFREGLPYMKLSMLLGLVLCAGLFWADVDAQIARYNVDAYQSGKLDTVDMRHLGSLSSGAVPYIEELTADSDPEVAEKAADILENYALYPYEDLRGWNYTEYRAAQILDKYQPEETAEVTSE